MNLKKFKLVGLDSNIFSYQFHGHPEFGPISKKIFDALSLNQLRAVTSIVTLTEILSVKAPPIKLRELEERFSSTPNLTVFELTHDIALEAARIRREYGFRLPDSVQLASAKHAKAKAYITNDQRLKAFKKLKVILLSEIRWVWKDSKGQGLALRYLWLAIARALFTQPKILVMDEPTSHLDTVSEAKIQQALEEISKERAMTKIIIAHRLSTVQKADQILVMERGKVVERGTHSQLLRKNGFYLQIVKQSQLKG